MVFIRPFANFTCNCHDSEGWKLVTKLRLGLSHHRFRKFKHSFWDKLSPICNCGAVEITAHHSLYFLDFWAERLNLFNKLRRTNDSILGKSDSNISKVLLFGDHSLNDPKINSILVATTEYINFNKTFWCSIIYWCA